MSRRSFGLIDYLEADKNLIITQVLNYGNLRAVRWLFKTYSKGEIKQVLRKPRRGVWVKQSIDYWSKILDVKPDPKYYKYSLFSLDPNPELAREFFRDKPFPDWWILPRSEGKLRELMRKREKGKKRD